MIGVKAMSGNIDDKANLRPKFVDFVADLKMVKDDSEVKDHLFYDGAQNK
jgi:hypothetical protein